MNLQSDQNRAVQSYIDALLVDMSDIQAGISLSSPEKDILITAEQGASLNQESSCIETNQVLTEIDRGEIIPVEGIARSDGLDLVSKKSWLLDEGAANSAFVKHLEVAQQKHQSGKRGLRHKGYPEWVKDPLNCLTVKVANLKLALPVEFVQVVKPFEVQGVDTVIDIQEQNEPVVSWRLGSVPVRTGSDEQYAIIDTARMIMPERYDKSMINAYQHIVVLNGLSGCLAVDSIEGEVNINVRDVRWRSQNTRRAWLAGTIVENMCAIIDIDALHRSILADSVLDSDDDLPA